MKFYLSSYFLFGEAKNQNFLNFKSITKNDKEKIAAFLTDIRESIQNPNKISFCGRSKSSQSSDPNNITQNTIVNSNNIFHYHLAEMPDTHKCTSKNRSCDFSNFIAKKTPNCDRTFSSIIHYSQKNNELCFFSFSTQHIPFPQYSNILKEIEDKNDIDINNFIMFKNFVDYVKNTYSYNILNNKLQFDNFLKVIEAILPHLNLLNLQFHQSGLYEFIYEYILRDYYYQKSGNQSIDFYINEAIELLKRSNE